jgi:hypothetical protein
MAHLNSDPLPDGLYSPADAAIIRNAQKSTRAQPIDRRTYAALAEHFSTQQIIDLCLTIGLSNTINRFHATFLTDLDESTTQTLAAEDAQTGTIPIARPAPAED